jgi:hypothetical protein
MAKRNQPEAAIQKALVYMLQGHGWYCMETHGNLYQWGFPDVYATHSRYGARWIEVKLPDMKGSKFTSAQMVCFPKLRANGTSIWIITGATQTEYKKLFKPCNIDFYLLGAI